ncbi:MAG: TM0106 family RecB-like putative nuclease [Propionibacteriaceae bacterium]|nr:TM0106 family RecB-like putative nuclease [Propionibacteriaceae bacterium]
MFLLDAYAARSCPVKTHNLFDPTMERPEPPDESLGEAFHGGREFELAVLDEIAAKNPVTDLRPLREAPLETRAAASAEAIGRGDAIIIDALLPRDYAGHRSGRPDLLVRGADTPAGTPGYHPVEVKLQKVLERREGHTMAISRLGSLSLEDALQVPRSAFRASKEKTLLQLAHYWRMLEAAGYAAAGPPLAGAIGLDRPSQAGGHCVSWVDLSEKQLRTFSRTSESGWRLRSALERYDHEHQFRVYVATQALARSGKDDPPPPVVPIVVKECEYCVWWERCRSQLDEESISLRINKSPLDVREISALSGLGIATLTDLADADLDELLPRYLPEVRHREGAESRLRLAARRARLMLAGIELERTTSGPIEVPTAEVEIDFDIETSDEGRTYLWGLLVNDRAAGTSEYHAFARFADLDRSGETALLIEFARFLAPLLRDRDALVYHYSDYERVFLNRLSKMTGDPDVAYLVEASTTHFVDLFTLVRAHFFGTNGLGLKTVAHAGAGFSWRDDDPGGLNSQTWFNDAVHADDPAEREAARVRVLEYNEDDVRATLALREWLRGLG